MKMTFRGLTKLLVAVAIVGSSLPALADPTNTTWQTNRSVQVTSPNNDVNPMTRYYKLYVPASYATKYANLNKKAPLVIVLHGGGLSYSWPFDSTSQNKSTQSVWSTWPNSLADQYGFLVAAPNGFNTILPGAGNMDNTGVGQSFNDCTNNYRGYTNLLGQIKKVDDVAFIQAMINQIGGSDGYKVDSKRIYVAGASNGGDMSMRLARELSGVVAAAGISLYGDVPPDLTVTTNHSDVCNYASTLSTDGQSWIANPQLNPVPLWMIKGTLDPFSVYSGGSSPLTGNPWLPYEQGYTGNSSDPSICASPANITTSPANTSSMSLLSLRYGLNPNPSSTKTYSGSTSVSCLNPSNVTIPAINSTVSCKVYKNKTNVARSEVDDCTALYNGHIEPSNLVIASSKTINNFGNQNQNIDTATEEWKFFQRFTHP